jgi:hypothetical protein
MKPLFLMLASAALAGASVPIMAYILAVFGFCDPFVVNVLGYEFNFGPPKSSRSPMLVLATSPDWPSGQVISPAAWTFITTNQALLAMAVSDQAALAGPLPVSPHDGSSSYELKLNAEGPHAFAFQ